MADRAHDFAAYKRLQSLEDKFQSFASGSGGEPPHNGDMEARVKSLEEAVKNLPTKADLDGLRQATKADLDGMRQATKADFAELRADIAKSQTDMHKAIADNHRWTHGALIGIATIGVVGIIGVVGAIWNAGKPSNVPAPAPIVQQQPPIIINVPAAAPPTSATPPQQ